MIIRAILAFLALPAMVVGIIPWAIMHIPSPVIKDVLYGWIFIVLGGFILISTVISFYRRGNGTLAPWDPPKHLVVQDLYQYNRNPMYVGVILMLLGWALITGNLWNYVYLILIPIIFHFRVILYEEKQMQLLFGKEWDDYKSAVPRWGIRLKPIR